MTQIKTNQTTPIKTEERTSTRALLHARRAAGLSRPEMPAGNVFVDIVDYIESELTLALSCLSFDHAETIARAARRDGALTRTALIIVRALELKAAATA